MEFFLKAIVLVSLSFIIISIGLQVVTKNLLFNHRRLSLVAKRFYNYFYSLEKISHLRTNNWGYAPLDDEMANYSPDLQYGMQLYKELVRSQNGYRIDDNCSIVEIGCGKGAGAEFLVKKFKPQKYVGIDYSKVAIEFCAHNYGHLANANFICADAHELPINAQSVDVVVNVESSHIYRDVGKFFKEVYRILKKDGKFLFTDFRHIQNSPIDILENVIRDCGFLIVEKRIISPQIYESCIIASKRREELVNEACPWYLKKFFYHYAVLKGTKKFKKLGNGEIVYFMYYLKRN